jgi:hypothetical protein
LCLSTAAALTSTVAADINIELRPQCEKRTVGQTVHIGIYLVSDDDTTQLSSATQVIFGWNPAELTLIGVDPPDPDLLQSSGFPDDPFGINEVIPPQDGDGIYIALAALDAGGPVPIPATPEGTLLNTLEFLAINPASPTTVSVLASAGSPPTGSIVFDDEIPNFDITGALIPAVLEINPLPYCPADIFPPGSPDRVVGPGDLGQLLANWGACDFYDPVCPDNATCPADLFPPGNPDGVVGPGDLGQLLANWGDCPLCGNAGAGNCFEADGTPGCEDAECCEAVCAIDSFCCDVEWDSICVGEAADLCEGCGHPDSGSCCEANGTPYCDDRACCDAVCAIDPFCCDIEWDGICADEAAENAACDCKVAGVCPENDNDCCVANETAGCNQPACCESVCAADPFCCETAWDGICAGEAAADPNCDCAAPSNDNCENRLDIFNGSTKFSNVGATNDGPAPCGGLGSDIWFNYTAECTGTITIDTCGSGYDTAVAVYDGCACPVGAAIACNDDCPAGGPCEFTLQTCLTVSVTQGNCYKIQVGGFSGLQGSGVINITKGKDCVVDSNCCEANGGVGCDNDACEACVCGTDPFCCDVEWDGICADEAAGVCAASCPCGGGGNPACGPGTGDCCVADGLPGCEDVDCCNAVCAIDSFCCDTAWDSICVGEAEDEPLCDCGG